MKFITARGLQHAFQLPLPLAAEMVSEQIQRVLRHRWQPWAWLIFWFAPALACWFGWQAWDLDGYEHSVGVWLLIVAGCGWVDLARWLAGPAMLAAAAKKRHGLHRISQEFRAL